MTYPQGDRPATSPTQQPQQGDASLQFDRADFGAATAEQQQPAATTCSACQERLTGQYYAAPGEITVCPPCRDQILASMTGGSRVRRFVRATIFGALAGIAGGLLWYAIGKLTGYNIGLIAIVVGFAVGGAVRKGSDERGGVGYQLLAVFITYSCIVFASYADEMYAAITSAEARDVPMPVMLVIAIIISYAAPVLEGFQNVIGMLIIGFALWQAWQINKYRPIAFSGPFTIAGAGGRPPPPVQPPPPPPSSTEPPPPPPPNTPPPQLGMT